MNARPECAEDGCTNRAFRKGKCRRHANGQRCTVPGCGEAHMARGLCAKHYTRQRRGQPLEAVLPPPSPAPKQEIVIEEVCFLLGTDSPDNLAPRLGYPSLVELTAALRGWGRADLAARLMLDRSDYGLAKPPHFEHWFRWRQEARQQVPA